MSTKSDQYSVNAVTVQFYWL